MKQIFFSFVFCTVMKTAIAQKPKISEIGASGILKDSMVLKSLNTLSSSTVAKINLSPSASGYIKEREVMNKDITVLSLSSKDSSNEYQELWVLKNSKNKTVTIFNAPNPTYKSINNNIKGFIKNVEAGIDSATSTGNINYPSYVNLQNGGTLSLPSDGSWSAWTNVGIVCEPDLTCLWGAVKGIKVQKSLRIRQMPLFNVNVPGISSFPGFPGIVEIEERNIFLMCRCK